jgi:hypothetical protein
MPSWRGAQLRGAQGHSSILYLLTFNLKLLFLHIKDKFVPVLLTKHHAIKVYWGVEVRLYAFLNSVLDGGEWSASHLGRFIPRERAPGSHWIGGWVGPRASLDAVVNGKIPSSCRDSPAPSPALYHWVINDPYSFLYTLNKNFVYISRFPYTSYISLSSLPHITKFLSM